MGIKQEQHRALNKMMKKTLIILFFLSLRLLSYSQYKIVKIYSEDIYINYYYKLKQTKRSKDDTTFYLCKTINPSIFYLEKYVNGKKRFTKKYRVVSAKDSLNVTEKRHDTTGLSKIYNKKVLYYIAIEIKK